MVDCECWTLFEFYLVFCSFLYSINFFSLTFLYFIILLFLFSISVKIMPSSDLNMLKIKGSVNYRVIPFEWTLLKLREITNYGKNSISSFYYFHACIKKIFVLNLNFFFFLFVIYSLYLQIISNTNITINVLKEIDRVMHIYLVNIIGWKE